MNRTSIFYWASRHQWGCLYVCGCASACALVLLCVCLRWRPCTRHGPHHHTHITGQSAGRKKTFVMRELPIASQLSTDMLSVCSDVHRFPCSVDQPQAVSVTLQARCVPLVCNAPCYVFCNDALCSVVCILGCPSHHICLNSIKPQAQ